MTKSMGTPRSRPRRMLRSTASFVRKRPVGAVCLGFLVIAVAASVAAPLIAPYSPFKQSLLAASAGPSRAHLLGTDELGRDLLSRLLYGGRITFAGVAEAVGTVLVLGVPAGLAAGYLGGRVDRWINNWVDLLLSVPNIIIVLAVLAIFGSNQDAAMVATGAIGAAGVTRVVRSSVLSVREELYVANAQLAGLSGWRIVIRHVLPRVAGPITVQGSLWGGIALGVETGLAFLGLGVVPPAPSWGGMIAEASTAIYTDQWMLVPAGAAVAFTSLAFVLLGDAIRDATFESWAGSSPAPKTSKRAARSAPAVRESSFDSAPSTALAAPSGQLLEVRDLTVQLVRPSGLVKVVDRVSFSVGRNEIVGVVGESGSGKSVSALAIGGLLPRSGDISGSVSLEGRELLHLSERQLTAVRGSQVAYVFQEPMTALDPTFTVGFLLSEVVRRHERISGAARKVRVIELLDQVRIADPASAVKRYPHELSGGMAQRVCIALALAGRPKLLIADEPTTALDVTVQAEILELLRTLRDETGLSVILVTHDWGVVADVCDRAVVMYAGQVVEQASVLELFCSPRHPYSSGLQECDPALARAGEELRSIPGNVAPPERWLTTCRFADRCGYCQPSCTNGPVEIVPTGDDHQVRCARWSGLSLRHQEVHS